MLGKQIKQYRENVELSQHKLSEKSHIAQNTLSQYENEKRMVDAVTSDILSHHLRIAHRTESIQLTNDLVRFITKNILKDEVLDYWATDVKTSSAQSREDVLLCGGNITLRGTTENTEFANGDGHQTLTLNNLFAGFKQWLTRSEDYVKEQSNLEHGVITYIDDIGINEICQYALFNDLLCDLPKVSS